MIQLVALGSNAKGTTRYLSTTGENIPPFITWETAARSLTYLYEEVGEYDTIEVGAGDFPLGVQIQLKRGVVIRGQGQDVSTIRGSSPSTVSLFVIADSNVCEGIQFRSGGAECVFRKRLFDPPASFRASNCSFVESVYIAIEVDHFRRLEVSNCRFEGWIRDAIAAYDSGDVLIENCTFTNTDKSDEACDFSTNLGERVILNNIFIRCGDVFLHGDVSFGRLVVKNNLLHATKFGRIAMNSHAPYIEVANNTMFFDSYIPPWASFWPLLFGADLVDSLQFYNNIIIGYQPQIFLAGSMPMNALANVYYNCFWSLAPWTDSLCIPSSSEYDTVSENLFCDPMLVDPFTSDFHLQAGSPCIDAGVPWLLDKDSSRSDMGAFGGPGGGFYAYQDFVPKAPTNLSGERESSQVVLQWKPNTESDIRYYALYRTSELPVEIASENLIAEVEFDFASVVNWSDLDSEFVKYKDTTILPEMNYYYAVVAVDSSFLASGPSGTINFVVTDVDNGPNEILPTEFELEQNYPNPFNATTAIVYSLPNIGAQPAPVTLAIYNTLGQEVRTLVRQNQFAGRQVAYWDGRDKFGKEVASGIYFYKLQVSGLELVTSRKMVLLR